MTPRSPIRFAHALEHALLVDATLAPVLPISSSEDEALALEACDVFGGHPEWVTDAREVMPAMGRDQSRVLGLGSDVEPLAALYAHMTGRAFAIAERLPDSFGPDIALVVALAPWIDGEVFSRLTRAEGPSTPGLVFDETPRFLRRQLLIRAIAFQCSAKECPQRVDLLRIRSVASRKDGSWTVVGPKASDHEVLAALTQGADLLHLETHGNGVDALLSTSLTLCGAMGTPHAIGSNHEPRCLQTGHCVRQDRPIARLNDQLVHPSRARARVLLFNSCLGLLDPNRSYAPERTLATGFTRSPGVGALVTPWTTSAALPGHLDPFFRDLAQGRTLGEAVARHNKDPATWSAAIALVLLGDPSLKLKNLPARRGPDRVLIPYNAPPATSVVTPRGELALLERYVEATREEEDSSLRVDYALLDEIELFLAECRVGLALGRAAGEASGSLHQPLLKLLRSRGRVYNSRYGDHFPPVDMTCSHCRTLGLRWLFMPSEASAALRAFAQCPACGVTEDRPVDLEVKLSLVDEHLAIDGNIPQTKLSAEINFWFVKFGDGFSMPWPMTGAGELARKMRLPELPECRTYATLWLLWETRYAELTLPCR